MKIKLTMEVEVSPDREKKAEKWLKKVAGEAGKLGRVDVLQIHGLPNRPSRLGGGVVTVKEKK